MAFSYSGQWVDDETYNGLFQHLNQNGFIFDDQILNSPAGGSNLVEGGVPIRW